MKLQATPGPFKPTDGHSLSSPPAHAPGDNRPVSHVINAPMFAIASPLSLHFANTMLPVVPGAGGYVGYGAGQIPVDNQPIWHRHQDAGPVRQFFRSWLFDNRVKHL